MASPREKSCSVNLDHTHLTDTGPMLEYISQYLLEGDIDENNCGYQEPQEDFWEVERSFYDVIGEKYPHSPKKNPKSTICLSEDQTTIKNLTQKLRVDESILASSEFRKGVEEGIKFLPTIQKLTVDLQHSNLSSSNEYNFEILEGAIRKKPMIDYEEKIRDEMYDKVLLDQGENFEKEEVSGLRLIMQNKTSTYKNKKIQEHIDLENLLIHCSEAVSIYNFRLAEQLLTEIRQKSSETGNGIQRLACILSDGLRARLAGSGSELYRQLVAKRINSGDILRSYRLCTRADPFHRVSYCFINRKILKAVENARKVHIIDLGICFGFQWPSIIQSMATRRGGPPELRITGIDFPQRGFRPAKLIEEIGKRLEDYARSFKVSFQYHGIIASEWESIRLEDLNVKEDEVRVVNSTFKFSQVRDEMSDLESPRNRVLDLICRIKPEIFIQGVYNVTYSSFFNLRFRQVLSQFSLEFDLRDSLIPRDDEQRILVEREVIAPVIINLIACEGNDWLERPETYKNWQVRNVRAGFEQVALDHGIVNECKRKLRNGYDKRFFIEEDGNWMLQGWKGKIRHAFSAWKPKAAETENGSAHKS